MEGRPGIESLQDRVCEVALDSGATGVGFIVGERLLMVSNSLLSADCRPEGVARFRLAGRVAEVKLTPREFFVSTPAPSDFLALGMTVISIEEDPVGSRPLMLWRTCDLPPIERRVLATDAGTDLSRSIPATLMSIADMRWRGNEAGTAVFLGRQRRWYLGAVASAREPGGAVWCPAAAVQVVALLDSSGHVTRESPETLDQAKQDLFIGEYPRAEAALERLAARDVWAARFWLEALHHELSWEGEPSAQFRSVLASQGLGQDEEEAIRRAYCFRYGIGETRSLQQAIGTLFPVATTGHPWAQLVLGDCYAILHEEEEGAAAAAAAAAGPASGQQAFQWYRKAAEQGVAAAHLRIGRCHQFGTGVPSDVDEANRSYEQALSLGERRGLFFGTALRVADLDADGLSTAMTYCRLGACDADTPVREMWQAFEEQFRKRHAKMGDTPSFLWVELARALATGEGVTQDLEKAWYLLRQWEKVDHSTDFNVADAVTLVPVLMFAAATVAVTLSIRRLVHGRPQPARTQPTPPERKARVDSIPPTHATAFLATVDLRTAEWYLRRCDESQQKKALEVFRINKDRPWARGALGLCYYHGWGVKPDHREALKCFVAGRPDPYSYLMVGRCHLLGHGTTPNAAKGIQYVLKAVEGGDIGSMVELAWRHEYGDGVATDVSEALKHYLAVARRCAMGLPPPAILEVPEGEDYRRPVDYLVLYLRLLVAQQRSPEIWQDEARLQELLRRYDGKPLLEAAGYGDLRFLTMLKALHCDMMERDEQRQTPLHLGAKGGSAESVRFLTREGLLEEVDQMGRTAVHAAVAAGELEALKALLEAGARLEVRDVQGREPVHLAIGNEEILRWLAENQVNLEARDGDGQTAMHLAAVSCVEALDPLEELGLDLEALDDRGRTPLHAAAAAGEGRAVRKLADAFNVSLDIRDLDGKLAGDLAAEAGHEVIVRALGNMSVARSRIRATGGIKNLVFQGGSVKGIAYLGAVREAVATKVITLSEIERCGGTSAGAITAFLIGLGYDLDEVERLMRGMNFIELLDSDRNDVRDALLKQIREAELSLGGVLSAVASIGLGNVQQLMQTLSEHRGLFRGDFFLNWVRDRLREKRLDPNITFAELHRRRAEGFKGLYFVATNLGTGQAETFSFETTPDAQVADAVRASMSIPVVFRPHQVGAHQYVDGGILENYPVDLFDRMRFVSDGRRKGANRHVQNDETLGFRLVGQAAAAAAEGARDNFFGLIGKVVKAIYDKQHSDHARSANAARSVTIFNAGVGMMDFDLDEAAIANLVASGRAAVGEFVRQRARSAVRIPDQSTSVTLATFTNIAPYLQSFELEGNGTHYQLHRVRLRAAPEIVFALFQPGHEGDRHVLADLGLTAAIADAAGRTALHLAAMADGGQDMIEGLIGAGADPNGQTTEGKSPLDIAIGQGRWETALELIDSGATQCGEKAALRDHFRDVQLAPRTRRKVDEIARDAA